MQRRCGMNKLILYSIILLGFSAQADVKRIAIIKNGVVENIAVWDGVSPWNPPADSKVDITAKPDIVIGAAYDGKDFTNPAPKPIETAPEQKKIDDLDARLKAIEAKAGAAADAPALPNKISFLKKKGK